MCWLQCRASWALVLWLEPPLSRGGMAARLPSWYAAAVNAPSFLLLPLMLRNAPFGLIYADASVPGALAPQEKELVLLRALRNQVVMAFRQVERA